MSEANNNGEKIVKKEGFFRTVIKSIKSFEKYEDFGLEGLGKTALYLLKIVLIFTLVVAVMTVYKFSNSFTSALSYFDENIKSLTYEDGILKVNNDEKLEIISQDNITGKIIVDTSELTEEQIKNYKNARRANYASIGLLIVAMIMLLFAPNAYDGNVSNAILVLIAYVLTIIAGGLILYTKDYVVPDRVKMTKITAWVMIGVGIFGIAFTLFSIFAV